MTEPKRCGWCGDDPLYRDYHDREWGREVTDDRTMFEFLTLESAQAGLSWITILRKRENYRRAFADFDVAKVAAFTDADVERLLTTDSGIIRNRLKVKAAITNARAFIEVRRGFKFFGTTICYAHLQAVGYVNDHLVDCDFRP
jgi:DNA-3-methyladenine glycosylase I